MDSILNNTSWAFIQGIGYQIKQFISSKFTTLYYRDSTYSATITVNGGFKTAFMDIVCRYGGVTAFTTRPVMVTSDHTSITELSSMWIVTNYTTEWVLPYPIDFSSIGPDMQNIVGVYRVTSDSTTIKLNSCYGSGNNSFSVQMSVFTYIVE